MLSLLNKNKKKIKKLSNVVKKINAIAPKFKGMSDKELKEYSQNLKKKVLNGESLDLLLVDSYALVREAALRTLGMWAYDVQLMSAIILHEGGIPEMKTGEGKTLSSIFPAYLNALSGKGVHIITVNDYLTYRDSKEMRPLFDFLGISVGLINSETEGEDRRLAYKSDIVYGTNSDFGFDYIKDNMVFDVKDKVQRGLNFAIIDEVDSILIDEARTPLIISGESDSEEFLYELIDHISKELTASSDEENKDGDYYINEKQKSVSVSGSGYKKLENKFIEAGIISNKDELYSSQNISRVHMLEQSIKANFIYKKDVDYVVKDNEIVIVDEFTGRLQEGRRWGGGLHQAVEIKEGVPVKQESKMLGSITLQNYFKLYKKISGMTGTAKTEEKEFESIYGLSVWEIPTNKPIQRIDREDTVFLTKKGKYKNLISLIEERHNKGQPILIGVSSINVSEEVSSLLSTKGIKHSVLNAKNHFKEAEIIEEAGVLGNITVATNMAGRGTDIQLGGSKSSFMKRRLAEGVPEEVALEEYSKASEEVKAVGGLLVIGVERNESRRIDNQLRGRSGRQGDVGESVFYLSLEDNLMRIFASDKLEGVWRSLGVSDDVPISHQIISKSIRNSQKKIEALNFESRKNLLKYDVVSSKQREIFYAFRDRILKEEDMFHVLEEFMLTTVEFIVDRNMDLKSNKFKLNSLEADLKFYCALEFSEIKSSFEEEVNNSRDEAVKLIFKEMAKKINQASEDFSEIIDFNAMFKNVFLSTSDRIWASHISGMENMKKNISLSSFAQKNPLNEYKEEAIRLFRSFFKILKTNAISEIMHYSYEESIIKVLNEEDQDPLINFSTPQKIEDVLSKNIVEYRVSEGSHMIKNKSKRRRRASFA